MQGLIELLAGFIALLVAACLSQFGVNLEVSPKAEREVHRISDCAVTPDAIPVVERPASRC